MHPDNATHLINSARRRHELTRAKAIQAIRELDRAGTPISFPTVAHTAQVSRSWLYTQPDIRAEIHRLRDTTRRAPTPPIPASQRTSHASVLARLEAALKRNQELAEENQRLRRQLAQALGERRHPPAPRKPADNSPSAQPKRRSSVTIEAP